MIIYVWCLFIVFFNFGTLNILRIGDCYVRNILSLKLHGLNETAELHVYVPVLSRISNLTSLSISRPRKLHYLTRNLYQSAQITIKEDNSNSKPFKKVSL